MYVENPRSSIGDAFPQFAHKLLDLEAFSIQMSMRSEFAFVHRSSYFFLKICYVFLYSYPIILHFV
jgi:hypothetical protein